MPLDFPNSPTVGATYTGPGGVVWTYDGAKWASGSGAIAPTFNDVGRNLIHNPLFNVAQRGGGPWTTPGFTMDRWGMNFVGGSYSILQGPLNDAFRAQIGDDAAQFYMSGTFVGGGAAGDFTVVSQSIEGVRRLAGKTVTISFWAIASANGMKLGIGGWQEFGTGGSPSVGGYITAIPVTLTTGFARYSVTLTVPSASGKTVGTNGNDYTQLIFWSSCGATNNVSAGGIGVQSGGISIWGVQLEVGSVATPLEKPDPQQDLAKCQRFYQVMAGIIAGSYAAIIGAAAWVPLSFPVTMRAAPTAVVSLVGSGNASLAFQGSSANVLNLVLNATAAGAVWATVNATASADL